MGMMLEISRAALDAIRAEAEARPDVEVCGLLLGEGRRVDAVRSCRNVAADPKTAFEIDPAQLIAAHRAVRDDGTRVIGHYHSHPNGLARPSARDAAAAYGGEIWIVVAEQQATAWRAEAGGQFTALSLAVY
jgi:desampylase